MRLQPARLENAMMTLFMFVIVATVLYLLDDAGVIHVIPAFLR